MLQIFNWARSIFCVNKKQLQIILLLGQKWQKLTFKWAETRQMYSIGI